MKSAKKPTKRPTENPTKRPTKKSIKRPTEKPTKSPTEKFTKRPTKKSTKRATEKLIKSPTKKPVENLGNIEILAPGGSMESVIAAVRTGANAVYLGGTNLSARQGAQNFTREELQQAVKYCHGRGVRVHLALNTVIFNDELKIAEQSIKEAAEAGVDAFIIQDLGMAKLARVTAPDIERHASTQMAVHNLWGVEQLAKLGFSRAVVARELTAEEIRAICEKSPIAIEVFVHGALCSSVSGQCYASSLIGGRSGNRGRCAQTCRLPFHSDGKTHALSLKDLSVLSEIPRLAKIGVNSFKIEGRLKRPEYVAAAVTACKAVLQGEEPDYNTLEAVFSRSGFTDGYVNDKRGETMFGTRTKEDVVSATATLKELAGLYFQEQPRVPVKFHFVMKGYRNAQLTATSRESSVVALGPHPQIAEKVSTTPERAQAALGKTGNTPFYLEEFTGDMEEGFMLPSSQMNSLRRDALDQLLEVLEMPSPKKFTPYPWEKRIPPKDKTPRYRVRWEKAEQFSPEVAGQDSVETIAMPIYEAFTLGEEIVKEFGSKILLELPRLVFSPESQKRLEQALASDQGKKFSGVLAGGYGEIALGKSMGYPVHGDFGLNAINHLSLEEWKALPLESITMSIEYAFDDDQYASELPKGLLVYGYLPSMIFRNRPGGMGSKSETLTDRLGNVFLVSPTGETHTLHNMVPLYLADRLPDKGGIDFRTLYFTRESKEECEKIFAQYQEKKPYGKDLTRGLYNKRIL